MFTGIVEEVGTVERIQHGRHSAALTIRAEKILSDAKIGDSIAVNGICLTVTALPSGRFSADVMHETLNRSSLSQIRSGSHVNLERAMPADGRFGGHIVAGHVDGVGKILSTRRDDTAVWYTIAAEPQILRYIVEKGSITVDGISLTVAQVSESYFAVSVIPHTQGQTILKERGKGDLVNLETDIIGKYVEKLMLPASARVKRGIGLDAASDATASAQAKESRITKEFLYENGF